MAEESMFSGIFGRIKSGNARLSYNGNIAIKTSSGYKTYNLKKGTLTKCGGFVLPQSDDLFFIMPTCKAKIGDIIIANGQPKCVIGVEANKLTCVNYENAVVETVLPERHLFMGRTYFYGKIVSIFGGMFKKSNGANNMMKMMMMSSMLGGGKPTLPFGKTDESASGGLSSMLPMMMMMGGGKDMFDGMFDFDLDDDSDVDPEEDDDDEEDSDEEKIIIPTKSAKKSKKK